MLRKFVRIDCANSWIVHRRWRGVVLRGRRVILRRISWRQECQIRRLLMVEWQSVPGAARLEISDHEGHNCLYGNCN